MDQEIKLGELLVNMGLCTPKQVRDAVSNQVIFGGSVGTSLLDLGAITEEQLVQVLGRLHGFPTAHGDIQVDPVAAQLVTADVVDRTEIIPFKLQDRKLMVLLSDPNALAAMDEIGFVTGKKLVPVIVAEARLWALMRSVYGVERELRGIEVDFGRPIPRPDASARAARPAAGQRQDLMSEEAFQAMYSPLSGSMQAIRPGSLEPEPPLIGEMFSVEEEVPVIDLTDAEVIVDSPPIPALVAARPLVQAAAPAGPLPDLPPLTFAEAGKLLEGVEDRSAIAKTVLRYARSKLKRAVLLTVQRGIASGWEGLGEGLTPQRVRGIRIKLGAPSAFETVVTTRAHYLGPMLKTEGNLWFLRALGTGAPKNAFLIPILVHERVVNVLYADNGRGGLVDVDVGELLILATKISRSYEVLISRVR